MVVARLYSKNVSFIHAMGNIECTTNQDSNEKLADFFLEKGVLEKIKVKILVQDFFCPSHRHLGMRNGGGICKADNGGSPPPWG